jgi:hypothetical protein
MDYTYKIDPRTKRMQTVGDELGQQRLAHDLALLITKHPNAAVTTRDGKKSLYSIRWDVNSNTIELNFKEQ